MSLLSTASPKFLIIRRDNIGDLVCTTPLIRALRQRFPNAYLAALVNSYNEPVLAHNPDVDKVYAYIKGKHRSTSQTRLGIYWSRFHLLRQLRRERFDYAIIASTHFLVRPLRLARLIKPKHIVGFIEEGYKGTDKVDIAIPYHRAQPIHLVEELAELLKPFNIEGPPPPMQVFPDEAAIAKAKQLVVAQQFLANKPFIGIHISARKASQRWPMAHFVALIRQLHQAYAANFMLFWSPGDEHNPLHPGDDAKAQAILAELKGVPILAFPTATLQELIAGLALTNSVICSDGGAMHLAAALAKPMVCFFGSADATVWYPWGVPHRLLQPASKDVKDISVEAAFAAYTDLIQSITTEKTKSAKNVAANQLE